MTKLLTVVSRPAYALSQVADSACCVLCCLPYCAAGAQFDSVQGAGGIPASLCSPCSRLPYVGYIHTGGAAEKRREGELPLFWVGGVNDPQGVCVWGG